MAKRFNQIKSQNKLYFCKLCPFVAESYEELDLHYSLEHDFADDISYELEIMFEQTKQKKKKAKTLKEKALQQLELLINGDQYHNEYVGWCEIPYYITTRKVGNIYKIDLEPGMEIC